MSMDGYYRTKIQVSLAGPIEMCAVASEIASPMSLRLMKE